MEKNEVCMGIGEVSEEMRVEFNEKGFLVMDGVLSR
jgi:hypothetical protein